MNHEFPPLIRGLLNANVYAEDVERISVRETHISWVLLAGQFAYKIKKPVRFGFIDFSTLEKRKYFCEEELRLNRGYSADLYLDVISITGSYEEPKFAGSGPEIEVALRMRQFDEELLFSNLLSTSQLTPEMLADLARVIHQAHLAASPASLTDDWGSPESILEPIVENFACLRQSTRLSARNSQLHQLEEWSLESFDHLRQTFNDRKIHGRVRECHGDLHLGNIVYWNGRATPFDCLEFNPDFRWIDTMNEIAFVGMDLTRHGRADLAAFFLNVFLEQAGDYYGVSVLRFYFVYRAIVRAKVELLRLQQMAESNEEGEHEASVLQSYLDLATQYSRPGTGRLIITHGLSGSGKTWGTQALIESLGAIRIRSDVERKRIMGIEFNSSQLSPHEQLYSQSMSRQTYDRLASLARSMIQAGFPVIVDATFLRRSDRLRFQKLAGECNVPFQIVSFDADVQVLRERIQQRARNGGDASDATIEIMEAQRVTAEPLSEDEILRCVSLPSIRTE